MARILVVQQSRTGTCRALAHALASGRRWQEGEVVYLDGRVGYRRCATDALLRRQPLIRYTGPNPATFDVVVLVSPVWCWRLSPPMRSFVRSMHGKLTQVAMVSCMGGSGAGNAFAEVERAIRRPLVARLALRQSDVIAGRHVESLQAFARAVEDAAAARPGPRVAPELRHAG